MNSSTKQKQSIKETSNTITLEATGYSLGRLASLVAYYLQDKHKPSYAPNKAGETVVKVTNIGGINFKANKLKTKTYYWHTGYIGHLKEATLEELWRKNPEKVFRMAVRGMLPKNKLRDRRLLRLKIS